jgi:PAS domain S-box-containing protein
MSDLHTEIVNTTRALIIVLDTKGRIVMFNPACERASGYRLDEVQGRSIWDFLLLPEETDTVKAVFDRLRVGQFPGAHENHWVTKSGERRLIEWSNSAATDESGRVIHIIGTGIDVTEQRAVERALQTSAMHLRDLAENLPLVFWTREMPSGRVNYISAAYEKIWGRRLGDVEEAYQSFVQSIHPDDRELLFRQIQREIELHEPTENEYRIIRPDGTVRWIHSRAIPFQDNTGNAIRIVGFADDITERKNSDLELREKSLLLSELQRVAHIGGWSVDLATGKANWSEEAYRIYGVSPDAVALTTKIFLDLIHTDDRSAMEEWIRACGAGEKPGDLEFRIIRPDGKLRILSGRGELLRASANTPPRMIGTVQDITRLKRAEQAAHEAHQRQKALLDSIPDGAWLINADGRVIEINDVCAKRWNIDRAAMIGKKMGDFLPASIAERNAAEDHEVMRTVKPLHIERNRVIDGRDYWFEVIKTPVIDNAGKVTGIAGVSRDITEQRFAETRRMERDTKLRATLIREVHHRILNNLQGIITLVQTLATGHPESVQLLDAIITRINAVASVHGLFGSTTERELRLDQILLKLVSSLNILYTDLRIHFSTATSPEGVRLMESEIVPLALIVNELIMNAVKHSRSIMNSSPVEITLESIEGCARVIVRNHAGRLPAQFDFDNGVGLGNGLTLVKSLLPPNGALLHLANAAEGGVQAELTLRPPVIAGA